MKIRFVLGVVAVLVLVSGCQYKFSAEKLEAEGRAARKVDVPVPREVVTSGRHDVYVLRKVFV